MQAQPRFLNWILPAHPELFLVRAHLGPGGISIPTQILDRISTGAEGNRGTDRL